MIYHLELIVHRLVELLGTWACAAIVGGLLSLAAVAFLSLSLYKFDRESWAMAWRRLIQSCERSWEWMMALSAVIILFVAMHELRVGLNHRLAQENQALYVSGEDAGGLPTVQCAPSVSILERRQHSQRIVLPPGLTQLESLPQWSPSQGVHIEDELVREEKALVLNRQYTIERYLATQLKRTQIEVALQLRGQPGSPRGQLYQNRFRALYTLHNPGAEPAQMRFSFPLPENSGTLADFHFRNSGQDLPLPDVHQGLFWEGQLEAGQELTLEVAYQHRGARSWCYDLAGRREPIADFSLKVAADRAGAKFERGSLYPTRTSGNNLEWNLKDQITSQSISLFFPNFAPEKVVGNLFVFASPAVLLMSLLTLTWARLSGQRPSPWKLTLVLLASCGGYTLTSYLISYLPVEIALGVAFILSARLQTLALQGELRIPIALNVLAPFCFLWPGHTGLLLTGLGLIGLWLTIRQSHQFKAGSTT